MNSNKRRSPILSVLLSLFLPGLGQIYNGQLGKALVIFCCLLIALPLMLIVSTVIIDTTQVMEGLLLCVAALALVWLYAVLDALISAWRVRRMPTPLQSWQCFGCYLTTFIAIHVLIFIIFSVLIRHYVIESFRVPSGSMEPNIYAGDVVFAKKSYNCPGCMEKVKHGDVVIFVYPNDRNQYFIKRVIGMPGDSIRIQGAKVWVNDELLVTESSKHDDQLLMYEQFDQQQWQVRWQQKNVSDNNTFSIAVPNGQVFVMGDNRSSSHDSRIFGTIPLADVIAKANLIWWSRDIESRAIHWERLGLAIQ